MERCSGGVTALRRCCRATPHGCWRAQAGPRCREVAAWRWCCGVAPLGRRRSQESRRSGGAHGSRLSFLWPAWRRCISVGLERRQELHRAYSDLPVPIHSLLPMPESDAFADGAYRGRTSSAAALAL